MFRNLQIQKAIAAVVLVTFTSYTLYPIEVQAQVMRAQEKLGLAQGAQNGSNAIAAQTASPDEQLGLLLNDLQNQLKALVPQTAYAANQQSLVANMPAASGASRTLRLNGIKSDAAKIRALYTQIDQSFADTTQRLKAAKLPQEILDRQTAVVAQYASRRDAYESLMKNFEQATAQGNAAGQQSALSDLGAFMAKYPNSKPHQFSNPNKLPFGINKNKVRLPNTSADQFQAGLFKAQSKKMLSTKTASRGMKDLLSPTGAPDAGDLAATDDVQITPAIQAQAKALGNNPVAIYQWVRNNVKFIPSYGSIQGSDMTLQTLQGNDMDTASLLIALFRASGIPARYAYATINVPASQVENWVGGVTTPEAALSLLSQGGIPCTGLIAGGSIQSIEMEHVYVEVYVDALTGGAKASGQAQEWFPVDASFKQYQFTQGMNIEANVPFDLQGFQTQALQGATVDNTNGYIQNMNMTNLSAQVSAYQNQVQTYVNSQKANATTADVLGTQTIVQANLTMLQGGLPYDTAAFGSYFQSVPDNLKWKFKTNIYPDDGVSDSSNPIIEINQSTASLAGKKLTLGFVPASPSDVSALKSYIPATNSSGAPSQVTDLPSSVPGYLINMSAEYRINGVSAASGGGLTMGASLLASNQYFNPSTGAWEGGEDNAVIVGEFDAIGIDLQGTSVPQLNQVKMKLAGTQATLADFQQNPGNTAAVNALTREDLTGDAVQTGILGYFAKVDASDSMIARAGGKVQTYRSPSYGRFFTSAQPHFFFGIVRSVSFPGVQLDVGYLRYVVAANDDNQIASVRYLRQAGAAGSAAEHSVPESMFRNSALPANDPSQPQGISAVKALALAAAQGQKIYTFNQANQAVQATILQSLQIDSDVKTEIANALASGMEVTVHEADIAQNGWSGCGYIIIDPTSGAGAYKIAGGTNGGALLFAFFGILGLAATIYAVAVFGPAISIFVGLFVIYQVLFIGWALGVDYNACAGLAFAGVVLAFGSSFAAPLVTMLETILTSLIGGIAAIFGLYPCTLS